MTWFFELSGQWRVFILVYYFYFCILYFVFLFFTVALMLHCRAHLSVCNV